MIEGLETKGQLRDFVEDLLSEQRFLLGRDVAITLGPWNYVTVFGGTWANFGAGGVLARYRKDPFGRVQLEGLVAGGAVPSVIFTLPAGYRPPDDNRHFAVASNSLYGTCRVDTNGDVRANSGSAVWFDLATVGFDTV